MNKKDRELVLKVICTMLPYGVITRNCKMGFDVLAHLLPHINGIKLLIDEFDLKPYLRPMSSMTIDELNDFVTNDGLRDIPCPNYKGSKEECEQQRLEHSIKVFKTDAYRVDWLNAHHFDYNGLIEKGLALEASEGMYN